MRETSELPPQSRIVIAASQCFFTVVTASEVENSISWESEFRAAMEPPWTEERFSRMKLKPIIESGSREFFTIVE